MHDTRLNERADGWSKHSVSIRRASGSRFFLKAVGTIPKILLVNSRARSMLTKRRRARTRPPACLPACLDDETTTMATTAARTNGVFVQPRLESPATRARDRRLGSSSFSQQRPCLRLIFTSKLLSLFHRRVRRDVRGTLALDNPRRSTPFSGSQAIAQPSPASERRRVINSIQRIDRKTLSRPA